MGWESQLRLRINLFVEGGDCIQIPDFQERLRNYKLWLTDPAEDDDGDHDETDESDPPGSR